MEYLPGSYESKLNTLFKPSNKTFFQTLQSTKAESVQFPIFIPNVENKGVEVDNNVWESTPPFVGYQHHNYFDHSLLATRATTTTKNFPILEESDLVIDLDLDGNIMGSKTESSMVTTDEPKYGEILNQTIRNVSGIIDEFLSHNNSTQQLQTPHQTTTMTTMTIVSEDVEGKDNITVTTMRPTTILQNLSPIASSELLITYGFFILTLAIFGIVTNSATIHVLFKEGIVLHIKRHYTNMTILSLALVNLLASLSVGFGGGIHILGLGFQSLSPENNLKIIHVPSNENFSHVPTITPFPKDNNNTHQGKIDTTNSTAIAEYIQNQISSIANVSIAEDHYSHNIGRFPPFGNNSNFPSNDSETDKSKDPKIVEKVKRKILHIHQHSRDTTESCKFQCFFSNLGNFVSIWTLAIISADRFFAHNWPVKYNQAVDRTKFAILIVYIWLQGIFFSSLSVQLWSREKLLDRGQSSGLCHCSVNWFYIPRDAPMGVAFFKLLSFIWMSLFPYTVIFTLNSITVYKHLFQRSVTQVVTLSGQDADAISRGSTGGGNGNPISRFFLSNPHQEQMIWRVMPPPLTPIQPAEAEFLANRSNQGPYQYQGQSSLPINQLFSAGGQNQGYIQTQQRRSRLLELHRLSQTQGGKLGPSCEEATTESVLTCYLAVIFAYIWLHTIPGCLAFLLFVGDEADSFFLVEMVALLFKLVGFSVNAAIYFVLRKDFHDAFSILGRKVCSCACDCSCGERGGGQQRTRVGQGNSDDDW